MVCQRCQNGLELEYVEQTVHWVNMPVLYRTRCTRSILKLTVANAKECLLNGVAGDTAPTWWKEAYALSEKATPSVVKCRYQYCRCIMKGVQQALHNEINNNDE